MKAHDSQWEDTCSLLAETSCRSFKKYVSLSQNPPLLFWETLTQQLTKLLETSDQCLDLVKTVYKSLADLAPICSAVISQDSINQILRVTRELISDETDRSCDDKTQLMKLLKSVPVIVESLGKIYE